MNRVYIATRLERHADHNIVRDALIEAGGALTYDWTTHGPVWRNGSDAIRNVSEAEFQGVKDADLVIVLIPGGRGTHVELGMAIALGKLVWLHSLTPDDHFGAVAETCAFYHHPLVTWRQVNLTKLGRDAGEMKRRCHYKGCGAPFTNTPPCALCYE